MKRTIFFALIQLSIYSYSQEPIDVTDQTIKIKATKEEELYFGFAEGDKVIFNFKEVGNKELKEIEVIEYPGNSKFSDFKTNKVENKVFNILKQSVYVFRFRNTALSGRICQIKIQRIPATESTKNFNTSVIWVTKQDTTWNTYTKDVVIAYDTTYLQKTKREMVKTEQREELIVDKIERVHSTTNSNGHKTSVFFTLPQNQSTNMVTKTVVAWAYWVGVGEEANKAWKANAKTIQSVVKTGAAYFTTPLGALAIGLVTDLMIPKLGEDVYYAVVDRQNRDFFLVGNQYRLWDEGTGVAGYKKFTNPNLCQGTYFICLSNDNLTLGIDVNVKAIAIVETSYYEDKPYTEMNVSPRSEKKLFKEPVIRTYQMPVTGL